MKLKNNQIKALLLDIGGVMLTNGWDTQARMEACEVFNLDYIDLNSRHRVIFDAYECGKMGIDEYLDLLVFYQQRPFSKAEFKEFMFARSEPYGEMLRFLSAIKKRYGIKIIAVNNEGKELNEYRIRTFGLDAFIDFFVSSAIVHLRKPDSDIYNLALDMAQVSPDESLYLDDRLVFIQAAARLGINGIHHQNLSETQKSFAEFGFSIHEQ